MASKFARNGGYEEDRFEYPVSENFKCAICLNVLNNPKSCRNNQHYFCFGCIGQHLENSHTCPECMEELTPATLVQPPRVLLNCVSELRIKCGYNNRGCPEYIQLGRLQSHAGQCGFGPAKCGNDGCGAEVNKCEKVRHETEFCKFRKVECFGCGELKKEIEELKRNQEKADKNMEETRKEMSEKQKEMDLKMAVMMENQLRMKEGVKKALQESLDKIESIFNDTQSDSRPAQDTRASKQVGVRSTPQHGPPINHDVIIMGGLDKVNKITNSVGKFCCKEGRWIDLAPMIMPRSSASSAVFDNQVIVSGGSTYASVNKDSTPTDSIEILNLDQSPLKWVMSDAKLPVPVSGHQTFVYKGKLIVICDYVDKKVGKYGAVMCKMFEVPLTLPYAAKELFTLPNPSSFDRRYKAGLVNDKVFIFGGTERDSNGVLVYDLVANECGDMPGLPIRQYNMSTVRWYDQIILLGGKKCVERRNAFVDEATNDVTMYDTETGESEMLPGMKHKRDDCSAVLTDDVIVVMGWYYNSVEFYDFRTNIWQALKATKEIRSCATAVVSPL